MSNHSSAIALGMERGKRQAPFTAGAREDVRNLRQTLRMRPVFIHHVVLEPHHYSGPRHIPVINTEGSRKDRAARMRKRGIFRGSPEEP